MNYIKHYLLAAVCALLVLASCKDDWDDRTSLQDQRLSDTDLWEEISTQSNLSIFKEILVKTGYAQYLSADNDISVLTLFAPTDAAFEKAFADNTLVKDEFMADVDGLQDFLDRHIANTMQMAELSLEPYRVKMWDDRRVYFAPKQDADGKMYVDEDIALESYNIMCKNGVMHTIESIIPDRQNVWATAKALLTSAGDPLQLLNAVSRFDYRMIDSASKITSYVDDKPVYDTLWIESNRILDFKDIANEDTVYTYVVLKDEGYIPLAAKYGKIYKRNSSDESDSLVIINLNLDLIFPGVLDISAAGEYESVTGVKVNFDPSNIVVKKRASNGYVYEFSTASIQFKGNKVKDLIIEGEETNYYDANFGPYGRSALLIEGDTFLRGKLWKKKYRTWASGNVVLNLGGYYREQGNNYDPLSIGGDRPAHYSMFTKARPEVFSVPYSFYWRMGNDIAKDTSMMIAQRIYISSPEAAYEVEMRNSSLLRIDYNEVYTQEFADTAAKFPANTATGYRIEIDRPTFAFYASIQDSMRYNYYLNNQFVGDTVKASDVMKWLLADDRYKEYGFKLSATDDLPKRNVTYTYTDIVTPDTAYTDSALLATSQFIFDYYDAYRASDTFPEAKAYLKTTNPQAVYYLDSYDINGNAHPDQLLMARFPDPTTGWKSSDYYTLEKYPNHEQQLYLTYTYENNSDYTQWTQKKDDAAYNRHLFTSYGDAVLLITRNFTGVASSLMFQQNAYIAIDYIRMEPNLDDIDE